MTHPRLVIAAILCFAGMSQGTGCQFAIPALTGLHTVSSAVSGKRDSYVIQVMIHQVLAVGQRSLAASV